jgi:hypothetical protein
MSNAELEHLSFLAMINADRPEKLAELRGEQAVKSKVEAPVQPVANTWLEIAVENKVLEIERANLEASERQRLQLREEIAQKDRSLRTALGTAFLSSNPVRITNGVAHFNFKGREFTVWLNEGQGMIGYDEKKFKMDGGGGLSEQIVLTLARLESI